MTSPLDEKGLEAARASFVMENSLERAIRAYLSTTHAPDGLEVVERICHKEQIGIWANEVLTALSLGDFLREEWTFDDSVDAEREIEAQLRSIIATAISHPEFDLLTKLQTAEAEVKRLTEALTDARIWHEEQDKSLSKQPPSGGPNGNQWARLQHREQVDLIDATLNSREKVDG